MASSSSSGDRSAGDGAATSLAMQNAAPGLTAAAASSMPPPGMPIVANQQQQAPSHQQQQQSAFPMSYQQLQNLASNGSMFQQKVQLRGGLPGQRLMVQQQQQQQQLVRGPRAYTQQFSAPPTTPTSMSSAMQQSMQLNSQQQTPQQQQLQAAQAAAQQLAAAAAAAQQGPSASSLRNSVYAQQPNMAQYVGMQSSLRAHHPVASQLSAIQQIRQKQQQKQQQQQQGGQLQASAGAGLQQMMGTLGTSLPQPRVPGANFRAATGQQMQQPQMTSPPRSQPGQIARFAYHQMQQQQQQQQWSKQQQAFSSQFQQMQQRPSPQQLHQLHQQQLRAQLAANHRPATPTGLLHPSSVAAAGMQNASSQLPEPANRVLGKRNIQELVAQVDARERLDSEVEDALLEIADDFIETVTSFACSLAKHRKSNILEAKDVLVHLERNWQMTIPGFGNEDSSNTHKKQTTTASDLHKQRIALVKKSQQAAEAKEGSKLSPVPIG